MCVVELVQPPRRPAPGDSRGYARTAVDQVTGGSAF